MVLFKKRESLNVPIVPSLPEFSSQSKEKELPSLPSGFDEDVNRNIIKSALADGQAIGGESDFKGIPPPPTVNLGISPEHERFLPEKRMPLQVTQEPILRKVPNYIDGPDSIFIRIDKFKSAKKELLDIKKSLLEAEAIINKIHEIKVKEDNEVKDINLNLENIKKKIGEVDSLVFNRI